MSNDKKKKMEAIDMFGGIPKLAEAVRNVGVFSRFDDWVNSITGLGTSRDKRTSNVFSSSNRLTMNREMLDEMYHGNDLVRKIIDIYAEEQTSEWFKLNIQDDEGKDIATEIMQELRSLGAQEAVSDAITWARLFGGSAIILGIDDGQKAEKPLAMSRIKSLGWIRVVDRWSLTATEWYTSTDKVEDWKIGKVKVYTFTNEEGTIRNVHESRLIRFDGSRTSRSKWRENGKWNDSALEASYEMIRDFDSAWRGVSTTMQDFSQAVYSIKGLANLLAADNEDLVLSRLAQVDQCRSYARAIPIDSEGESFTRDGATVTGLADLLDRGMMRLAAGVDIPVTRLFGRSAAGMNATGKGEETDFQKKIKGSQNTKLKPRLEYLIEILFSASEGPTGGQIPASWSIDFNELIDPSEKEKSETRKTNAEVDKIYIDAGVVAPAEVRSSRFGGNEYSAETTIDPDLDAETLAERPIKESPKADGATAVFIPKKDRIVTPRRRGRNS